MAQEHDEVFADGNMTPVVRRGNEVRRTRASWWRASEAVLQHLENVGFPSAPRHLGFEGEIERLSFVEGESAPASLDGYQNDEILIKLGELVRAYHEAMSTFVAPTDIEWPVMIGTPRSDGTICHNDIGPWNVIFDRAEPTALIDWDLVAPGTRAWDLAYAAWRFAPVYPDDRYGGVDERLRRITLLLDSYGLSASERRDFPALIRDRMRTSYETVEVWGKMGIPGFSRLYEGSMHVDALDAIAYVEREMLGRSV